MINRRPALAVLAALCLLLVAPVATEAHAAQPTLVSAVPRTGTPQIADGAVFAIAQVGSTMVAGGSFTAATSADGGTRYATPYVLAFDATTGAVRTSFRPRLDGRVEALLPGPVAGTVYVGGDFKNVGTRPAKSLVLLNLSDGSVRSSFAVPELDGMVHTLALRGSRLFVGGSFTRVGTSAHGGLATLDPTTGAVDPYLASTVTVHHNWTPTSPANHAEAPVGVNRLAISPDGTLMVAIGNFKMVDGTSHDQIAMWSLPTSGTATLRNWATTALQPACLAKTFDTYARDVAFSPDGSYFSEVNVGGGTSGTLCDSASRWESAATGQNVRPTWVDYSGGDSLLSTTVTAAAVYVGGHERWLNNGRGSDNPGPGAVPRPGVAALDPATGVPLVWNPGRNPRGAGTYTLYATSTGLWMGSDTDYIGVDAGGDSRYLRAKIALFPLAGGRVPAGKALAALPGTVYVGTGRRSFDGTSVGRLGGPGAPLTPSAVHGTTFVGDTLFYTSGSSVYRRTRAADGTWGPQTSVDPYDDPVWSDVKTGSGGVYRGTKPSFYTEAASLTALFYDGTSRLYYTLQNSDHLYFRSFSPDSGVVPEQEVQVPGVSLPALSGAFLTGGNLYYVTSADGNLHRAPFARGVLGPQTVVSGPTTKDHVDWRSPVLFLAPK